jgi:ribonuclease P/MRP protein subunit RPP1
VSLDLSVRFPTFFKHKMLMEAIKSGKKIEICYAQGLLGDAQQRRQLISNATQLIRATRGRGLVISSEAKGAVGLRGPWDVVNLAAVWELGQERGHEAVSKEARSAVVSAQLKRTGYRGVINVVYGGEKPAAPEKSVVERGASAKNKQVEMVNGQKRKADAVDSEAFGGSNNAEKPLSKTQMKKRAKKEKMDAEARLKSGSGDATAG